MHKSTLEEFVRSRAKDLALNLSEVCRQSGVSRQTLYSLSQPGKMPALPTIVALAEVLHTHPMRLLQIIFDHAPISRTVTRERARSDHSAFARDVSYPDGALVLPGQKFVKTWEVHNVGKIAWEGRFLQCMDEEIVVYSRTGETLALANNLVPTKNKIPVPFTKPGESAKMSVSFTAPDTLGTVLSYWKSVFADGSLCFPKARGLWCKVRVSTLATAAEEQR